MVLGQGLHCFLSCVYALAPWTSTVLELGVVGDGREKAMLKRVLLETEQGNPQAVLCAVDQYCKRTWLMCVGDKKGLILDSIFKECDPRVALELGAYCGYSAVRMAMKMQKPNSKLVSLEMNPDNADTARQLVKHAGLSERVQVVEGILSTQINELKLILKQMSATCFDFVFIDHAKEYYLSDFLLLKGNGLIAKGTVIVADNMIIPGSPKYREYLKDHPNELETVEHKCKFEHVNWLPDSMMVSTVKST